MTFIINTKKIIDTFDCQQLISRKNNVSVIGT